MTFKQLAEYFEKLESTSSRLILIDILAELFSKLESSEVEVVCYLLQSRIAPFYEAIEMGMAEKHVASSIARAYREDRQWVLDEYGRVGDLGLVALQLNVKSKIQNVKLQVTEVFDELTKIAKFSGEGTVENKIAALSGLLTKMGDLEAKHLVRIPLGVSRLGIGDPTILDAFAKLKLGDRSKRKLLESAYNKVSDLGLIGKVLWQDGLKGVEKLDITVGRPLRSQLCERITDSKTILEKFNREAHLQYKYDGFRVQIHKDGNKVRLFSRNLEETTSMFPDIVAGVLKQVKVKSAIFDSEALAYNPESEEFLPFQETTKRRRKYDIDEMALKLPLKVFVFDVMYLDGKSLIDLPLETRVRSLERAIRGNEVLIPQPGEITNKSERIEELFQDALSKGLEGLIVKRVDSKYEAGARNFNWIKLKRHSSGELQDTVDCVILGYIFGKGKRSKFGAGALLVGIYDQSNDQFVTVSKIGTGLTDEEWREIHRRCDKIKMDKKSPRVQSNLTPSVWIKPEIVIEVLADEITKSPNHTAGLALRFPRLIRFREDDKQAEDATTVDELNKLYLLQYKK